MYGPEAIISYNCFMGKVDKEYQCQFMQNKEQKVLQVYFFPVRCMHHKCIIQKIVRFTSCPQANPGFSPVIGKTSNCWLLHSMLTRLWNQCSPFYHTPPFSNNTQLMAQHTTSVVVNAWTARQSTFARTTHGIAKYPAWLCHNGNTGPSPHTSNTKRLITTHSSITVFPKGVYHLSFIWEVKNWPAIG